AAAAPHEAAWTTATLGSVNERSGDNFNPFLSQIHESLQPLVAAVDFECDVLERVVPGATVLGSDLGGVREQHDIVVIVVKAHEGHLPRPKWPPPGQREAQNVPVPRQRAVEIRNMDTDMPDATDRESLRHVACLLVTGCACGRPSIMRLSNDSGPLFPNSQGSFLGVFARVDRAREEHLSSGGSSLRDDGFLMIVLTSLRVLAARSGMCSASAPELRCRPVGL